MGAIEGIVKNASNVPIQDASIVIVAGPSHQDIASLTDVNGNFAISNLRQGHYIIKAFGKIESDNIPVQVFKDQIAFVEIWLDVDTNNDSNINNDDDNILREVISYGDDDNTTGILATQWKVKNIKPAGAPKAQGTTNDYILDFKSNNKYFLNTDINYCEGTYKIASGGKIYISRMNCTEAGGDSQYADKFTNLLSQMTHYEVKDNLLILKGKGEITLTRYF